MTATELTAEQQLGIRAHYITGHHGLETALLRIQNGGFVSVSRDRAAEILRQPISVETVKALTGRSGQDITEEQIAARLAKVTS
jgi:hypothetical protein